MSVHAKSLGNVVQVGDVIDPIPEAGHEGPQYVTAVNDHPDGTALDLRPATPEEIAAASPATSTLITHDGTTIAT